ncbi:MAG: T9SS type A sorting domain-containing protein [Bacteroidales bacterium]|nr:T9SS type A sorting domain-containing protein [Bacteroidales bacterium]
MKTKFTLLILVLVTFMSSSWAQPIITEINGAPLGTQTFGHNIPGNIIEGTAGANQTWDYSDIPYDPYSYYFKSIDFSTLSPDIQALFPTGNLANEVYFGTTLVATQVFQLESTDFLYLGINTTVFPVPDTQLVFPHNYLETHAGFTYDAYGTMITPFGTFSNVVRLKETVDSRHKYDYWQFEPFYILLMEYYVDTITQVVSEKAFYNTDDLTYVNENERNNRLEIFPNPVVENLNIQTSITGNKTVEIYDISGRKLISQNITLQKNATYTMDVAFLEKGLYLVKIAEGEHINSRKFVVQ